MSAQACIWKPNEHADEYMVFVEDVKEFEQWKVDKSIAMSRFLGPFTIYKSATGGHTGSLGAVSQQEIENAFFGDDKKVKDKSVEAAIQLILQNGSLQNEDLRHSFKLSKNMAQGAGDIHTPIAVIIPATIGRWSLEDSTE